MTRNRLTLFLLTISNSLIGCHCLMCYKCENEPNNFLCIGEYNLKQCEAGLDTCQTTVTYSDVNERLSIIKTCTKNTSCQLQIKEHKDSVPCDKTGSSWICTMCCNHDACNLNNGAQLKSKLVLVVLTLVLKYLFAEI